MEQAARIEPLNDEVLEKFCTEDIQAMLIANYARRFIEAQQVIGNLEDAVNRVSGVYAYMDKLIEAGDQAAMEKAKEMLKEIVWKYDNDRRGRGGNNRESTSAP
jgi:tRNA C32,U32 (ribose-2'-O)-methylase TrmJ